MGATNRARPFESDQEELREKLAAPAPAPVPLKEASPLP
jgi:hypothetical protein